MGVVFSSLFRNYHIREGRGYRQMDDTFIHKSLQNQKEREVHHVSHSPCLAVLHCSVTCNAAQHDGAMRYNYTLSILSFILSSANMGIPPLDLLL